MSRYRPTSAEAVSLRFLIPGPSIQARWLLAAALFVAGVGIWVLAPEFGILGLGVVLAGHLPLWVRRQTTAPGGATPEHEEIWAPTETGWLEQVGALERRAEQWDTTPWDLTNKRGCLVLLAVAAVAGITAIVFGSWYGFDVFLRLSGGMAVLLVPIWLNGVRTTWNPSELRLKGEALEAARRVAEKEAAGELDVVPLLALREGRRGKYPVDAKLMLRPARDDGSGFIGVQVQVSLNNVRGTDYPYLYCVVLGKPGFSLPDARGRHRPDGCPFRVVYERGGGADVDYLVIRRYADQQGGWHTDPRDVEALTRIAVEEGRRAWQANRGGGA